MSTNAVTALPDTTVLHCDDYIIGYDVEMFQFYHVRLDFATPYRFPWCFPMTVDKTVRNVMLSK